MKHLMINGESRFSVSWYHTNFYLGNNCKSKELYTRIYCISPRNILFDIQLHTYSLSYFPL